MKLRYLVPLLAAICFAEERYQKPPQEILDILNAPVTPRAFVSPSHTDVLLAEPLRYPAIADVAQPMLRLAGIRINPRTNGPHRFFLYRNLMLKRIDGGAEIEVAAGQDWKLSAPRWSADGKRFAFTSTEDDGISLWVGDAATGHAHKLNGLRINGVFAATSPLSSGDAVFQWMPDNVTLLVQTVPEGRGAAPAEAKIPTGPHVQESLGHAGPVPTFEDLLSNEFDAALFDYYATAQLAFVDAATGRVQPYGKPAIFDSVAPAPSGSQVLVSRVHRPYSYLHPYHAFPKEVEVWDRGAALAYKVASLPLADRVPIEGVPTGPRAYEWIPNVPATLVWVEAMDGGNPKEKVPHRDRIVIAKSPFTSEPVEVFKTPERFRGLEFSERQDFALVQDYERRKRWLRTFAINPEQPNAEGKVLWALNAQDRYHDPGRPVLTTLPNGRRVVHVTADSIFLAGAGASPLGDRPFLDRMNLETKQTQRLFQSQGGTYETFVSLLNDNGTRFLTERESPASPPNYYVRTVAGSVTALTHYPNPVPQLQGITKQLITYKRPDGVPLSFTLYLPPGYKQGTRLPTVVWAYPFEYNDAATAGQVSGSTDRFTTISGYSELFFALRGYAVLDNAAMPVVGDPDTVNNTYIEQIVADAKAAIDKAVEIGVTDPGRVGVGGHSYGAFMTANLLAHSNLFRAGIARSGAYNRTLTPFGFQSERRTFWEAPEVYTKMSPFWYANQIKAPLLMIHGEADDNTGTFPIQSERMYQAIRGNGGTVRLVFLPGEAHGYVARETTEDVLYEMIAWFDKYVKNAEGRPEAASATASR